MYEGTNAERQSTSEDTLTLVQVPRHMAGDALDLVQLLAAVQVDWAKLSPRQRVRLNEGAVELVGEFFGAVKESEDDLGQPVTSGSVTVEGRRQYRQMCDERVAAVTNKLAQAAFGERLACSMRARWALLRLLDFEPGHHRWFRAKTDFKDMLVAEGLAIPITGPYGGDLLA